MSFAEGIKAFNTIGACVKPVRINKSIRSCLMKMICDSRENISVMFREENQKSEDRYLTALKWIEYELTPGKKDMNGFFKIPIRLNKQIALDIHSWQHEVKYHELCYTKEYEDGMQWLTNKINQRWSMVELYGEPNA